MLANLLDIISGVEKALTKRSYEEANVNYHRMPCSDEFWYYFRKLMTDRVDIEFEKQSVTSVCVKRERGFVENIRTGSVKGILRIDSAVGLRRVKKVLGNNIDFTYSKKPKGVKRAMTLSDGSYTSSMTRPRAHDNLYTMNLGSQSDPTNTSLYLFAKGLDFQMTESSDGVSNGTICIKIRFNSDRQAHAVFVDPIIEQVRQRQEQAEERRLRAEQRSVTSSMRDMLNNHQPSQPSSASIARAQRLAVRNVAAASAARSLRSDGEPHSETEPEDEPPNVVGPTTPILANSNNESLLSSVSTSSTTQYNRDLIVDGTIVVTELGNVKVLNYNGEYYRVKILSDKFYFNGVTYKKTRQQKFTAVTFYSGTTKCSMNNNISYTLINIIIYNIIYLILLLPLIF
jgi:hypothetical protein